MNDATAGSFTRARYQRLSPADYPRAARIVGALAKAGWAHYAARIRLPGGEAPAATDGAEASMDAVRLREAIEQLGPTFVKFGQLLSLRRDIFPDAYIDEFSKLQDQVPADAATDASAIIERELGRPVDVLFGALDRVPFAAASIAQVHHASLPDGVPVVVKVQREGIEETIHSDLGILYFLAREIERHFPESRKFSPTELVDEFAANIIAELDFRREGHHADRFRENFSNDPSVVVPRVFWDLTTPRVLTMEESAGQRAPEYSSDQAQAERGRALAANLAQVFFTQVFEHGFFHGDPHPGNVFVLADGRLCFHDFGIVGALGEEDKEHLAQLLMGVAVRDPEWVADAYVAIGVAKPSVDRRAFVRDLDDALAAFYDAAGHRAAFSEILRQFIRIGQHHRIRLPRVLLAVSKAAMQVEAHALLFDPAFNIATALQRYSPHLVKRLLLPDFEQAAGLRVTYRRLRAVRGALDALPEIADRLVEGLREGRLRVELRGEQLQGLEERIARAGNRLSFSLIIASIIIASALVMSFHAGPHYEGVALLGVAGFVIGGVLGLWWAVAVLRSGRL
ncbi:MAG TPA: AarF/ABC1/UbiB kinase family protein [Casimicrobiaceae bacterium]